MKKVTKEQQNKKPNTNSSKGDKRQGWQKSNRRSKGKTKNTTRDDQFDPKDEGNDNDPRWYATDPALLRDAASIPFSWPVGIPIDLKPVYDSSTKPLSNFMVPGVQVIYTIPSIGYSAERSSALNIASQSLYSYVRHANSGSRNYDSPDLMIYNLAMSSVYSYINFLQRTYALATLYSGSNRYLPKALLQACGLTIDNADSVQNNLAQFRYGINLLINKASSFAVPAILPIFARQSFMYQNIYTAGTSIKDQLYMYAPAGFWQYALDPDGAGCLKYKPFMNDEQIGTGAYDGQYSFDMLLEYGNALMDAIMIQEDCGIISGDILKAYGESNLIKLGSIPEFIDIVPVFDIGVLEQMKNARVISSVENFLINYDNLFTSASRTDFRSKDPLSVYQDANKAFLQQMLYAAPDDDSDFYHSIHGLGESALLSTTTNDVSPELVMESTRLMVTVQTEKDGLTSFDKIYCGTELPVFSTYIYNYPINSSPASFNQVRTAFVSYPSISIFETASANEIIKMTTLIENFRFHHFFHILEKAMDDSFTESRLFYQIDNHAVLDNQVLKRLHDAAIMNELNTPSIAKSITR